MKYFILVALLLGGSASALAGQAFVWDPDRCWTCRDTREHYAAGAAISAAAQLVGWPKRAWQRVALVTLVGAAYELGQEETVRYVPALRSPGYGFGLKDLGADVAGALLTEGLGALWRKVR